MKKNPPSKKAADGFTLIELLVIVIIVGILSAIAVPSWLQFLNRQRANAAQDKTLTVMRDAQANAKREKRPWEVCFQDDNTQVSSSVHAILSTDISNPAADSCSTNSEPIAGIDSKAIAIYKPDTNLPLSPNNFYRVQFNYDGSVVTGQSGKKITFTPKVAPGSEKRCVIVSTILGNIRTEKGNICDIL